MVLDHRRRLPPRPARRRARGAGRLGARRHRARRTWPTGSRATSPTASASWSACPGRWRRDPKLILLDEPAAGLDTTESQVLGSHLREFLTPDITVFLIDHDMGLVLNVCDYIYVLDFGRIIAQGTPAEVRANPAVIGAYLGESAGEAQAQEGVDIGHSPSRRLIRSTPTERHRMIETRAHRREGAVRRLRRRCPWCAISTLTSSPARWWRCSARTGRARPPRCSRSRASCARSAATIQVLGEPVLGGRAYKVARRGLAHVAEDRSLFFDLTVYENIRLGLHGPAERAGRGLRPGHAHVPRRSAPLKHAPGRPAVGRRAADAGHGPGAGLQAQGPARRRDEPRPRSDHRGAHAPGGAAHRRRDRHRRPHRRAARPHGPRRRRPGLRPQPRQAR